VRTHANHSLPHRTSDQTRTTEIADLLTRLAALLSEHSPDTEKPWLGPVSAGQRRCTPVSGVT
jgi:hypothetical protein